MQYNPDIYVPCFVCGQGMIGIKDENARDTCESCGGNTTEFHKGNPWKPTIIEPNKYEGFKI